MRSLRKWTGRAKTKINFRKFKDIANGRSEDREDDADDHRRGAEGNAFQVNDPPEQADGQTESGRHGAEGHAFQVNDPPEQADGQDHGDP